MRTLYIDTSSNYLYTGIVEDGVLLGQVQEKFDKDMSTYALVRIQEMFNKTNLKPDDIDKIIVVNGPGSYTGIRIGVTIAKVYAWSLKKDITTITSLEAMALSSTSNVCKIPLIDARRGFVFASIFDTDNNQLMMNRYISLEALKIAADSMYKDYAFITNNNVSVNHDTYKPNILRIVEYFKDKEPINPHNVNPVYLKKTEAEEEKGLDFE